MALSSEGTTTSNSLLVLEKDLICSICTEVLYQPLTVLDCLHTFCGSCLKEWFSHQYRKATSSRSASSTAHPYTCPTCRSPARDVQRFSVIGNFLENFLAANPERGRSEADKEDMRAMYHPGENILPKTDRRRGDRRTRREEHDLAVRERQMIEEATQRSLRDTGFTTSRHQQTLSPPQTDRARSSSYEREERRQRRRERERQRELNGESNRYTEDQTSSVPNSPPLLSPPLESPRHPDAIEARHRERRMVHQASLRSLVSASESGSGSNDSLDEARVMQEILSQGLLDGIDVDALTEEEQDALANRIAEAYRQRHLRASVTSSPPQEDTRPTEQIQSISDPDAAQFQPTTRRAGTSPSPNRPAPSRDPPVSRRSQPAPNTTPRAHSSLTISHPRRTSDHSQSRDAGRTSSRRSSPERAQGITRSVTELPATQQDTTTQRPRGFSASSRQRTESRVAPGASEIWLQVTGERRRGQSAGPSQDANPALWNASQTNGADNLDIQSSNRVDPVELDAGLNKSSQAPTAAFDEPSISCFRCLRHDIQYELHKRCDACQVDLCHNCYRKQEGCNHWLGFGRAAEAKYAQLRQSDESVTPSHVLTSRRYQYPELATVLQSRPSPKKPQPIPSRTTSDPLERLQEGHFCDRCGSFANDQFWICDECNDGEWGFCRSCVNTHHCCKHQIVPVKYTPPLAHDVRANELLRPASPHSTTSNRSATKNADFGYDNLTIFAGCDNCKRRIEPIEARFHCPSHPTPTPTAPDAQGDYDLCTSCYNDLYRTHQLRREDGPDGWRKCPDGHRMIVLAFEPDPDEEGALRRVVHHDLVGGWKMSEADIQAWQQARVHQQASNSIPGSPPASSPPLPGIQSRGTWSWRDDPSTNRRTTRSRASTIAQYSTSLRYPPEGGFGSNAVAVYSYYPEEGDEGAGELMFPRQGDISEIEKVNDDWWSGVYAGEVGFLPSGYVKEIK